MHLTTLINCYRLACILRLSVALKGAKYKPYLRKIHSRKEFVHGWALEYESEIGESYTVIVDPVVEDAVIIGFEESSIRNNIRWNPRRRLVLPKQHNYNGLE